MKLKYTLILLLLLCGCAEKINQFRKVETLAGRTEQHTTETTITDRTEVRDTTLPAPREHSRNTGTDSSYLSTSLAWSIALYKDGRLDHCIGNFPSLPSRIVYRDRFKMVHDTTIIRDTVKIIDSVKSEIIGLTWIQRQWIMIGKLAVLAVSLLILSGFGKNIIKRLL